MKDGGLLTGFCMSRCSSRRVQPACQTSRRLWSHCDRLCRSTPTLAARPAPHTLTTTSPACSWSASLSRTILPTLYSPLPDSCIGRLLHYRKEFPPFHLLLTLLHCRPVTALLALAKALACSLRELVSEVVVLFGVSSWRMRSPP